MLHDEIKSLHEKLDSILMIHGALPIWYPLTQEFACECGYKTLDGLRKWCFHNLPPDQFEKRGRYWMIHINALHLVKLKSA